MIALDVVTAERLGAVCWRGVMDRDRDLSAKVVAELEAGGYAIVPAEELDAGMERGQLRAMLAELLGFVTRELDPEPGTWGGYFANNADAMLAEGLEAELLTATARAASATP